MGKIQIYLTEDQAKALLESCEIFTFARSGNFRLIAGYLINRYSPRFFSDIQKSSAVEILSLAGNRYFGSIDNIPDEVFKGFHACVYQALLRALHSFDIFCNGCHDDCPAKCEVQTDAETGEKIYLLSFDAKNLHKFEIILDFAVSILECDVNAAMIAFGLSLSTRNLPEYARHPSPLEMIETAIVVLLRDVIDDEDILIANASSSLEYNLIGLLSRTCEYYDEHPTLKDNGFSVESSNSGSYPKCKIEYIADAEDRAETKEEI